MQLQAALPFSLLRAWKDCFLKMQSSPLLFSPQVRISEHVGVVANGPESPIVPVYGKPVDDVAPLGLERQQEVDPIVRDDESRYSPARPVPGPVVACPDSFE